MGDTWVVDMRHYVDLRDPKVAHRIPGPARRLGEHFGSIVEAVTAGWDDPGLPIPTMVRCRRRPKRKPCPGLINAQLTEVPAEITWRCDHCDDGGYIHDWQDTPWNLAGVTFFGDGEHFEGQVFASILVTEEEYAAVRGIRTLDNVADRVVKAARGVGDGDVLVQAPRRWLGHLRQFIEAEANHTRSKKRRALLGSVLERE